MFLAAQLAWSSVMGQPAGTVLAWGNFTSLHEIAGTAHA
jgi:hypothetical protein